MARAPVSHMLLALYSCNNDRTPALSGEVNELDLASDSLDKCPITLVYSPSIDDRRHAECAQ